ncbi:hypothetical protein M23134_00974 [Microscilla marina ATCC 23134]|uniref:Uncharacterized protein n=1 Tax=Microscilla marina ATCC 23134 TaxID=313606 RepID=A1ZZQ1_MICM2|nr:hypothetical protein M23134_00974 [Microscilla marina ATCC 23134]
MLFLLLNVYIPNQSRGGLWLSLVLPEKVSKLTQSNCDRFANL